MYILPASIASRAPYYVGRHILFCTALRSGQPGLCPGMASPVANATVLTPCCFLACARATELSGFWALALLR